MNKITFIPGDLFKRNGEILFYTGRFKTSNNSNFTGEVHVLVNLENGSIRVEEDEDIGSSYTFIEHVNQKNDFIDSKGNVLRRGLLFTDPDNPEDDSIIWKETVAKNVGLDEDEIIYTKEEFKRDCTVTTPRSKLDKKEKRIEEIDRKREELLKEIENLKREKEEVEKDVKVEASFLDKVKNLLN